MTEKRPSVEETMLIGQIVGVLGLHGKLKLRSYTDRADHIRRAVTRVYLGAERRPYTLTDVAEPKPGLLVISLRGVDTRDAAEALRGQEVAILESDAAPLAPGEYFIHQLYGLSVVTDQGEELGRVREVLQTGSNDVLVVTRMGQSDALIPMISDVVRDLDIAGSRVVVHIIPGLLA